VVTGFALAPQQVYATGNVCSGKRDDSIQWIAAAMAVGVWLFIPPGKIGGSDFNAAAFLEHCTTGESPP